jgi:hypothetical protein
MTAAASLQPVPSPPPRPDLAVVQPAADPDQAQLAVERRMLYAALLGMAVGALVCIVLWGGVVLLALAGSGEPLTGPLLMAALVGAFAGLFFGGWVGTMYGAHLLEEHERATRPRVANVD